MPRKEHKFHFIYKTTNLINGKYYIGMHSTSNLNDGYLGSGKRLWNSIEYYGKENFKIEILEFHLNRNSLKERERELINEDTLKDKMCMNLTEGGGGFSTREATIAGKIGAKKSNEIQRELRKNEVWVKNKSNKISNINSLHYENGIRKRYHFFEWAGKKHKPETIEKMKKSKNVGEANSQFGTCWITNGIENKKIKKEEQIPDGWYKGRKT